MESTLYVIKINLLATASKSAKFVPIIYYTCDPTVVICYLIWPCDIAVHITYLISHSSLLSYNTVIKGYFRLGV